MTESLTAETASSFRIELSDPTRSVYLVAAPQEDYSWTVARSQTNGLSGVLCYRTEGAQALEDYLGEHVSGWPDGFPWRGQTPAALCFGFGKKAVYALTQAQTRDSLTVEDALVRAQEITRL